MPVLIERQRRAREIGRIRLGEQRTSQGGKKYPAALSTFRLTSPDRQVLESAACTYGGAVSEWEGQFQVTLGTDVLPVILPPHAGILTAWLELWSGSGCLRRCTGELCTLTDPTTGEVSEVACLCDPVEPECKPTTRLSVILRDLPGVGVWRCESHGRIALDELEQTIATLSLAWSQGTIVPGRLRIEKRTVKRPGKPPNNFVVPVLDVDVSVMDLLNGTAPQIAGPVLAALPAAPSEVDPGAAAGGCSSHQSGETCQLPKSHGGAHRHGSRGWTTRMEDGR